MRFFNIELIEMLQTNQVSLFFKKKNPTEAELWLYLKIISCYNWPLKILSLFDCSIEVAN